MTSAVTCSNEKPLDRPKRFIDHPLFDPTIFKTIQDHTNQPFPWLIRYPRLYRHIMKNDLYDVNRELLSAAGSADALAVKLLIRVRKPTRPLTNDTLGTALHVASSRGYTAVVESITQCGQFSKVDPYYVGAALKDAGKNGHLSTVNTILQCGRLSDISDNDLGYALAEPACKGHTEIVKSVLPFTRCKVYVEMALRYASRKKYAEIEQLLQAKLQTYAEQGD